MDEHLSGNRRAAVDRRVRRLPDAAVHYLDPIRLYRGRAYRRRWRTTHFAPDHCAAMSASAVGARDLLVSRQLGPVSLAIDGGVDRPAADLSARSGAIRRGIRQSRHRADGDRGTRHSPGLPSVHDPAEIDQSRVWLERTEIDIKVKRPDG